MAATLDKTLPGLRSTRDLRAEILALAAELAVSTRSGRLTVVEPVISVQTVREEWARMLPALKPGVSRRMHLEIGESTDSRQKSDDAGLEEEAILLDRPNYRFEVLRLLLDTHFGGTPRLNAQRLVEQIGASQTAVRQAIEDLREAGVAQITGRRLSIRATELSIELLARVQALPQSLRFRFERGASIKPPAVLLERATPLLGTKGPSSWRALTLSGTPAAQAEVSQLDLLGLPRLDLVLHASRDQKRIDGRLLRRLDSGLEREPNVLAPAPVVVTIVRAQQAKEARRDIVAGIRCASRADVFLSLLEGGLRAQAQQYARGVRK